MGLVTLRYVLQKARQGNYAVGGFNFFTLENLQGIAAGAARQNSPVIAMASTGALKMLGEKTTVAMARSIAEEYGIQLVLHLDHCTDMALLKRCVDNGFTSVMIDASSKEYQENVDLTAEAVEYAAKYGCSVEAELGHVGGQEDEITVDERTAMFTRPEEALRFVKDTGIDALAVAVGTVHGFYKSEPKLDFPRISAIHELVPDMSLVLHGGTGVPEPDFIESIRRGVRKINVGTELKAIGVYETSRLAYLEDNGQDPRKISKKVVAACADIVAHKIEVFGSVNKA